MGRRHDTISFLSDYGRADEFVGVVTSVIRSVAPHVTVVDIVHDLTPHDVRAGALALVRSVQYLCPGVVLAVVDPGVGTERRLVAVEVGDGEGVFVAPDNGLVAAAVSMVGGAGRAVSLTNTEYHLPAPGPTFAGRDILAPVAAQLCNGVDLADLGELIDPITLRPGLVPLPREEDGALHCEVLWVDRFGNIQLNVGPEEIEALGERVRLRFRDQARIAVPALTYGALPPGQIGLVVDSYGLVSVVFDRRSAADELGLSAGAAVALEKPE
ncbi:MAG TPA: SAM-dependent chlorinase/fluorinase [Acidimicrobiales bacterium]|nr:SAM-dependent chlorinase/fluorinase [Acidimicrobiales bacterium]